MKRLSSLFLLIFCISFLLAGCTINVNIDNPSKDSTSKIMYESWATIYISDSTAEGAELSILQSDLASSEALLDTYIVIFNSNSVQDKIRQEYPDMEYTATIEQIDKTAVLKIKATSENPENLEEICNMAVSLLCEKASQILEGSSCKIIDPASQPTITEDYD